MQFYQTYAKCFFKNFKIIFFKKSIICLTAFTKVFNFFLRLGLNNNIKNNLLKLLLEHKVVL